MQNSRADDFRSHNRPMFDNGIKPGFLARRYGSGAKQVDGGVSTVKFPGRQQGLFEQFSVVFRLSAESGKRWFPPENDHGRSDQEITGHCEEKH
jgi:hypothetical protein